MLKIKKQVSVFLAVLLLSSSLFTTTAFAAKLNKSKVSLKVGQTYKLKVLKNSKKIKWSSSKKKVATVSKKGVIKAKKAGKTTITAKVGSKKYKCKVTVRKESVANTPVNTAPVYTAPAYTEPVVPTTVAPTYGQVKGQLTYQYNKFIGTRGDNGAKLMLIPKNDSVKNYDNYRAAMLSTGEHESGIIVTQCDGYGNFDFGGYVPTGEYLLVGVSKNTTSGSRYNDEEGWKQDIRNEFGQYFSDKDLETLMIFFGFSKLVTGNVTVLEDHEHTITHDFGYTYF